VVSAADAWDKSGVLMATKRGGRGEGRRSSFPMFRGDWKASITICKRIGDILGKKKKRRGKDCARPFSRQGRWGRSPFLPYTRIMREVAGFEWGLGIAPVTPWGKEGMIGAKAERYPPPWERRKRANKDILAMLK